MHWFGYTAVSYVSFLASAGENDWRDSRPDQDRVRVLHAVAIALALARRRLGARRSRELAAAHMPRYLKYDL
jgi:hypothetical protein